ncbi:uncharacterized protein LOC100710086 isoform X2 [Oreochromis niloticus]|uniref:Uncharacterized LOC100710086 n=1 Tax=Oreochromis niloticus TaxID=8128 RepID=A0A669EIH8_ORENI|nr:uncharacterized protein LOC100710086 isoform X2 [Oreochromis niloticus]CAI5685604.1 unnamed protein product [Mustela putorius furo]
MSHPLHNPYNFGIQSSTQHQNALSSSGASSGTSDTTLGTIPSLRGFPVTYIPPQSSSILDGGVKRSTEMYLGQARKEMRQQPVNQAPCFTGTQEDKFISSTATVASSPVCSASQRHSDFKSSGPCSLDSSSYKKATENDSSRFFSSSTSLSFQGSGESIFSTFSERERDMQSIPGLGDSDYRMQDKPVLPTDSSYPKYSSQEASNILLRFGLEKDDLEYLISYPEDQITPGNLPFILRQIRMKKAESVKPIVHSKACPEPQPTPSMTVMDRFRREGMQQEELAQIIKPSKVIDYGHTSKYTGGFGSDIGKSSGSRANSSESGSMLLMDTYDGGSCNREPLQESTTEVKTSTLVSSCDLRGTVSTNSSMQSYEPPPSWNPTQRLPTQSNPASQEIISSFSLPKKDTDLRLLKSKLVPLKEPEPDCHLALKAQPPLSHIARGVHPDRPGLVLIGNNDNSCTKDQSESQQQAPKVAKPINKQKVLQRQMQQELKKQAEQQRQQDQKQPPVQMGQRQCANPVTPLAPQIIPKPVNFVHMPLPLSSKQCLADRELSEGLPALAMMQDYAAATPQTFPHTCSLCLQKCTGMKEWLLHQNTSFHLDNCKLLRKRYPQWDGKVLTYQGSSNTGKKSSPSSSGKTSQHRHQKTRRESRSRSRSHSPRRRLGSDGRRPKHGNYSCSHSKSPHHHFSSGGRREKLSSGSRSPNSSRHARRSRSRSFSPRKDYLASLRYRSHSRSHERRSSPRRRHEKQLLQKRNDERRSPTRRRDDKRLPLSRSHKSSSSEKRPQQKKLDNSTKRLAKQLLETTGLHSLSKKSDLEAIAEILAELAKMKSPLTSLSSSASTSSSSSKKEKTIKSSESKPGLHKSEASTSSKPKASKSFPSTTVKLHGIVKTFSHEEVVAAVEHFGKTESIVLYRSKLEAKVNFMKEEDAQKLKKLQSIDIKGIPVTVVREQDTVTKKRLPTFTKKQEQLPQKKIVKSTKSTSTRNSFKKPLSLSSGEKKNTTGKLVTKAKVLVSKAKGVSTKQISKTLKQGKVAAKGAVNVVEEKKDASNLKGCNNSKSSGKQQGNAVSKQRPTRKGSESNAKNSVVAPKDTVKVDQLSKKTMNPIKGTAIVTHAKVLVAQAQTASTIDKPQSQLEQLAATVTSTTLNVEEITVKGTNVLFKTSEDKPGVETLKPPEMEIKFQQPTVVSEETTEVLETRNATASGTKNQADDKVYQKEKEVKHAELLESVYTKVVEPIEVESFSGSKCLREPESSEIGQMPPQTSGSSAQAALDTKQTPERIEKGQEQQKGKVDTVHATNVPSKPKTSENKPDETFKTPKSDTNVQESAVMPEDRVRNVSASEMKQQTELAKVETKEASHTEPLESGNKKVTEPKEVEHFTDITTELTKSNKGQTPTSTSETTLVVSPTKHPIDSPHRTQTTIKKPESYENTEVQESGIVPEKTTKVPETKKLSVSETQQQANLLKVETKEPKHSGDCFEDTEVQDSGSAKNDVDEAMEVEHFAEKKALLAKSSEGQTPASTTETKPIIDDPQRLQTRAETKEAKHSEPLESGKTKGTESMKVESSTDTTKTIVKNTETLENQKSAAVLENTTKVLETRNGSASETKHPAKSTSVDVDAKDAKRAESLEIGVLQMSGSSTEAALEAKQMVQSVNTVSQQKDLVIDVTSQKDPPSKTVSNVLAVSTAVAASSKTEPTAATAGKQRQSFSNLTFGEKIEKLMDRNRLNCFKNNKTLLSKVMLITNLPEYQNSCYTEADVANQLTLFGFGYMEDDIYVIPQMRMAFAIAPSVMKAKKLFKSSKEKSIILNGSTLCLEFLIYSFPMNPLGFYSTLMNLVNYQTTDDGSTVIYIKNISPSEANDLREALEKIGSVKNYLPLLNKVFIEFESIYDADRLGVWYSLLKQGFGHNVYRIKIPRNESTARPPRLAAKALPDSKVVAEGATIPTANFGVPQGSTSPFWVTMKTYPFLFPTASPWFVIPDFLTVQLTKKQKNHPPGSVFPHIMLTGLPEGNYRHEDVAKLVWHHFPVHNLHTLYYKIIVLSLQRRAFVYFSDWNACTNFVQLHRKNPISVGGRILNVHFVLQDMHPGSSEEVVYRNLMKWSNIHVPDSESLEERLLCVEISETSVDLIMMVMQVVASSGSFVRFLPLANRIYIEMAQSSRVTQVLEKIASNEHLSTNVIWNKVRRIETLKSLKQRLQDSSEIKVNLELDTTDVKFPTVISGAQPSLSDKGPQTLQQTSTSGSAQPAVSVSSNISKSLTTGQSATSDQGMEETSDKPGTEITITSTIALQASQDVEKAEWGVGEEGSPVTSVTSADGRTVSAASTLAPPVTSLTKSKETIKELPYVNADKPRLIQGTKTQSVDKMSPSKREATSRSDMDKEKMEEKTSGVEIENQSLVVSTTAKQISTRSFNDSMSSSSSSVSRTSVSSSLQSIETPPFPCQTAQPENPESPEIALHSPSSSCRPSSSMIASTAAAADVTVETYQLHRDKEAKPTESAVGKSGKVLAEGITTETNGTEISVAIHSAAHSQGLELTSQKQNLEIDFNNGIHRESKERTEEVCRNDYSGKYPEEEDFEDYQILDSIEDQTDEQMNEDESQDGTETNLSGFVQEPGNSYQVMDSVTEDQAAIVKEDSQEDATNKDVLDSSMNQTPRIKGARRSIQTQEEMQRSFKASENLGQILNVEKQSLEEQVNKDMSSNADCAKQETFEILDSIDDSTDDHVSSETHIFDELNFSLEDFVTVDEIGDHAGEAAFSHQSCSSHKQNSRRKRERQSSHISSSSSSPVPTDITVKGNLSSNVSKTSSSSFSQSFETCRKTHPSSLKSPARALHTSSSDCRTHSLKMASAAAAEASVDIHQLHKETSSVESESRQSPGPEKSHRLHELDSQVMESDTDAVKTCSKEWSEIGLDASVQVLHGVSKHQVTTIQEDDRLVENEDSAEKRVVEENKIQIMENSDKSTVLDAADKIEMSIISSNQSPRGQTEERRRKEKEEMFSEESCKAFKDADNGDMKDNLSDSTDQETFEILDSTDDHTDDHASSNTSLFDEQNFNLEDFVTVDEIVDDVEDLALDHPSTASSKQNSRMKSERQGSNVSSPVKQTSTRSLKDSKSSAIYSSFSHSLSKSMKATVRSSLCMAMETPASSVEKAPSSNPKSPARALQVLYPGFRTCASKAALSGVETCQPNEEQAKPTESLVVKSDHKVSADGIALKIVESKSSQSSGHEQGQKCFGDGYKVLDSIEDESPEEFSEMEMDAPFKALDSVTEDQTATVQEATQTVENEGSTLIQLSEEHMIQVDNSDKSVAEDSAERNEVLDASKSQASRSRADGRWGKEKEEQMLSGEACKDSGQMTNVKHQSIKEASPDSTEEEGFEALDSANDHANDQLVSDTALFDEQNFNLENFVTVDEIFDDSGEDQSTDVLSSAEQTSLKSLKGSLSPSSSKTRKSTLKSSLSSNVKMTSLELNETPASPDQKRMSSKAKSPARASYSSSSGFRTHLSKLTLTALVGATIETHQLHREEPNPTESVPVKSDHKVSIKGIAGEIESEISQTPGPEQGQELHEGGFQVLDSVNDDDTCLKECSEIGLDASRKVLDNDIRDQITTVQEPNPLAKNESSTVKQLSEDLILVVDLSDKNAAKSSGDGSKGNDEKTLLEESSKASKDASLIAEGKKQALEEGDNTVKEGTEKQTFEILDSTDSHNDDYISSDIHLFDEQNFESFVTVDEIVEDVDDNQGTSSSEQNSRKKRKRQNSDVSSSAKQISTRSSKESKNSALSSKSKSTEASEKSTLSLGLTTESPKKQKGSSEPTKFNTISMQSAQATKTPLFSSSLPVEIHASPFRRAQPRKTESPARRPHTVSSGHKTHLSEMASTSDIEASVKIQYSNQSEKKTSAKSDHKVSAEGITAGDYVGKCIEEEEEDGETYQVIDSVDDQTEEQLDKDGNQDACAKTKYPGPKQSHTLHGEGSQILDNIKYTIRNEIKQHLEGQDFTSTNATEAFEILDSVDDLTEIEDDNQKLETLSTQVSKEATEEEEEAYQVIDSVEDEPATAETKLEADNKEKRTEKSNEAKRDDRQTRTSGSRTRTSKSEEEGKLPIKEDKMVKKYETRTKKSTTEKDKNILKDTEKIIHGKVNFDKDESVQDAFTAERSDSRRSARGYKEVKLAYTEQSKKPEAVVTDNSNSAITAQSTSGRKERTAKEVPTKDKTTVRRRTTWAVDSQKQDPEKNRENEERAPPTERTPTTKSDALIKDLREDSTYEMHPAKDDDVRNNQPATSENTRLERPRKYIEKTVLDDTSELVTLDEVGADEGGEKCVLEGEEWNREITEDELQEFVTLDEIGEEEEEGHEVCPLNPDSQSVKSLNRETLSNVNEAVDDENKKGVKKEAQKISRSNKRKRDDNAEENVNLKRDEDKDKKAVRTRTSGQARKRTRQIPVRKSVRGKKGDATHEREDAETESLPAASLESSSLDKNVSVLSSDDKPDSQKTEEKPESQPDVDAASAGQQQQPEYLDNQTQEGPSRSDVKAISKRRRALIEPKAKRSCSQSPHVTDNLDADASLGDEHVVQKMGLFCNLCSIFYLDEQNATDLHCRSQKHQVNLKKHQQKLRPRPSRMSTRNYQGSVKDEYN